MLDQFDFFQSGLELLEGIELSRQSEDPAEISSWDHLLFANNSAMFELTNAEKTRIVMQASVPRILNSTAPSPFSKDRTIMSKQTDHFLRNFKESVGRTPPGSTSIHLRTWNDIVTLGEDDHGNDVRFGLALATGLPALAPISSLRISCISSDISVTFLFKSIPTITQE